MQQIQGGLNKRVGVRTLLAGLAMSLSVGAIAADKGVIEPASALQNAIHAAHRSAENHARDAYRHPLETLEFFDVQPDMTVVEIWPGAGGWYTEILAPYLRKDGQLIAAHFNPESSVAYFKTGRVAFDNKLAASPDLYDKVKVVVFDPPTSLELAPAGSVDRVLTFRNVHNWFMQGGEQAVSDVFESFFVALKPGGILGVVDHRLPESQSEEKQAASGYLHESFIIRLAEAAGFKLAEKSEINANPRDKADYPQGVWTLPPSLRLGETDRDKYLAIGESDRMTLKFVKP